MVIVGKHMPGQAPKTRLNGDAHSLARPSHLHIPTHPNLSFFSSFFLHKVYDGSEFYWVSLRALCLSDVRTYLVFQYSKPISLISHSDVRYRGILAGIDPAASTIQLSNGKHSFHSVSNA